jgi:hypothetical protein
MDDMREPTPPRRRFQFSILQILECMLWVGIGAAMVGWMSTVISQAWFNNSILIFTIFLPGVPFGAAVGALFRQRLIGAVVGVPVCIAFMVVVAVVRTQLF